ncbi:hypothetical protein N8482_01690 [Chitinophagales bacterium]|nr:hypothetical protein [Chitinophagales bacterium]
MSYLLIPVISALVGWGTNVLALKMTFYPLEFKGIPPLLGWQGIIPNKSKIMAEKSVDMILTKLIDIQEQFSKLSPELIAQTMGPSLDRVAKKVTNEVLASQYPVLWKALPLSKKDLIFERIRTEIPVVTAAVMQDVKEHITELFDAKQMVINELVSNKSLLNEIFLKVGKEEFKFIERSGLWFGGLFGLIQMAIWIFFPYWFILPIAGLLVGYLTNLIALKLIFFPIKHYKIGSYVWQGLFIKRQKEVSAEYAEIVASKIFTSKLIFDSLLDGPYAENVNDVIKKHIHLVVDAAAGDQKDLFMLVAGTKKYEAIKNLTAFSFCEDLPIIIRDIFPYTEEALEIESTLRTRMSELPADDFVGFLRPVFQEDEWKLILVGAILGFFAGFMQWLLLF